MFQAALAEFARVGTASAQIPKIVEEAGVSVGTFYRYFASKEEVLAELQRRFVADVRGDFEKGLPEASTLRDLLCLFADCVLRERPERNLMLERETLAMIVRRGWPTPDWNNPLFGPITDRFRDAQRTGLIRMDHPPEALTSHVSTCVFGCLTGVSVPSEERRQTAHTLIDLLLAGLSSGTGR